MRKLVNIATRNSQSFFGTDKTKEIEAGIKTHRRVSGTENNIMKIRRQIQETVTDSRT